MELPQQNPMTPEQAFTRLQEWYIEKRKLNELKQEEHLERVSLVRYYFHNPVEGTNRLDIGGGYDLKLVHGYNIKVDEAELDNVKAADIKRLKLPWDDLFVYKPTLSKSVYNGLTAEQKKFVDQLLDIKESSPQLDIVPRANTEGQQAHIAAAEAEAASNDAQYIITPEPEKAEPGNYYNDGETWWVLGEDVEWKEVTDVSIITSLDAIAAELEAATAPQKPARKRATTKRTKAKE